MKASRINILTALLSCALLIALLTFIMTTTVLRAVPEEVNKSPGVSSSGMAPGLVGTSTEPQDSVNSVQRKTFYADGLFWALYAKDWRYLTYYTSPDGITWTVGASSPLETSDHLCGDDFSICFDGTYFHYVYAEEPEGTPSGNVYYRRGIPNADGSITWSTPSHQTVLAGGGEWYFASVTVDSSGRPWITYANYNDNSPPNVGYVTCSSTADGVWNTAAGFPYQLTSNGCTYIVPLTGNKMYAYWLAEESQIYGKLWNGSSWGPQETVSSSLAEYETFASAVSDGDNISLVFFKVYRL